MPKIIKNNRKNRRNRQIGLTNYGRLELPSQLGFWRGKQLKHYDLPINTTVTTTGFHLIITGFCAGGATVSSRVGNVIHVRSVDIEFFVNAADATNFIKTYLMLSMNGQAGAPSFTNWYDPPDSDQYLLLRSRLTSSGTPSLNPTTCVKIKHSFPGEGLMVRYDNANTFSEIFNRLSISMVSDSSVAAHPSVYGYSRIYFTDA